VVRHRLQRVSRELRPATRGSAESQVNLSASVFGVLPTHDLPDFDFIGMHGIWSWISEEDRALIVEFIRRKLKPAACYI